MKTDPVSAAVHYRKMLERILHARVLHEAHELAAQALNVTFDKPGDGFISISSGYGQKSGVPFVTLSIANPSESANPILQLTSAEARVQAHYLLEAADAAETDGFLIGWFDALGQKLNEGQIGALLLDFRAYRERLRGKYTS